MLPSRPPPPPFSRCATDKEKTVRRIYVAQPLAYQGCKYASCVRSLSDPDHIYTSPQKMKSPKVKSFELPRINEHQSLRKVAGC